MLKVHFFPARRSHNHPSYHHRRKRGPDAISIHLAQTKRHNQLQPDTHCQQTEHAVYIVTEAIVHLTLDRPPLHSVALKTSNEL